MTLKLLFMKIRFERDSKGTKVFTKNEYEEQARNHEKNVKDDSRVVKCNFEVGDHEVQTS